MTAITAVTVQNTTGVMGYETLSPSNVGDQIRAVASDIGVDAAKTGMLADADTVIAVAEAVEECGISALVVDPVFVSKHGHALLMPEAVEALRERILPLATLVTPNLPEAAGLAGMTQVRTREDMRAAADAILASGPKAALIKGGHLESSTATDLFVDDRGSHWLEAERIDTADTHGTGCTLSAAIAAYLAMGRELDEAVRGGKGFVTQAIRHALRYGRGIGPVDPLWNIPPPART
jgi:hydroxymethylpyrimidine/phosphomethylpyrimidine kinase